MFGSIWVLILYSAWTVLRLLRAISNAVLCILKLVMMAC